MSNDGVKKLAEVEAFLNIGAGILRRAGPKFEKEQNEVYASLSQIIKRSYKKHLSVEQADTFTVKTDKTTIKLNQMMELYIGDSWDNSIEVLEWLSFYSGAGAAHCAIANTLLTNQQINRSLISLEESFKLLLNLVIKSLKEV